MDIYNLISLSGMITIPFIAWLFSENRRRINVSLIIFTILIELFFVAFIFKYPAGTRIFSFFNQMVITLLNASTAGSEFLFGRLAVPPGGKNSLGFFLAFQAFPTIVFFSALVSVLYLYRILPLIINLFSYLFSRLLKISGAESLGSTAGFFFGVESLLTVKPYLKDMTRSEINTLLTVCMSTVSSNVLGLYVFSLKDVFPNIAAHIISASFLSIPAAFLISKLIVPETEQPATLNVRVKIANDNKMSLFEAISNGASEGVKLIVGIAALLIAVLGLVELIDVILNSLLKFFGGMADKNLDLRLKDIMGVIFYPFAILIGINKADALTAGKVIGERLIITEVGAYHHLKDLIGAGVFKDLRTPVIISYVLCGFTHTASLAIFTGAMFKIVPGKTQLISSLALKSFLGAILTTLLTGAVAGVFLSAGNLFLGV